MSLHFPVNPPSGAIKHRKPKLTVKVLPHKLSNSCLSAVFTIVLQRIELQGSVWECNRFVFKSNNSDIHSASQADSKRCWRAVVVRSFTIKRASCGEHVSVRKVHFVIIKLNQIKNNKQFFNKQVPRKNMPPSALLPSNSK